MPATYTFDVFCTLDGYGSYDKTATGAATGAHGPEFSIAASPCTARSSGWCWGRHLRQFVQPMGPSTGESKVPTR